MGLFLCFSLITHTNLAQTPQAYYTFKQIRRQDGVIRQVFADFDGDGNEECIYHLIQKGALLMDFDEAHPIDACQLLGAYNVPYFQALDLDADGKPEIALSVKQDTLAWAEIARISAEAPKRLDCELIAKTHAIQGNDFDGNGEWDGWIDGFEALDVNRDGQKDMICTVNTGFDQNPRGIFVFDGATGEKLWEFLTAGPINKICCADLTGDGDKEILLTAWATDNQNATNGMADSKCYLICLDKMGQILWKDAIGGVFFSTDFVITELNALPGAEICCVYASGDYQDKSTWHELQIRDGQQGALLHYYRIPTRFRYLSIVDFNRDTVNEILAANHNGSIFLFDSHLNVLAQKKITEIVDCPTIHEVVDLNQDGEPEILLSVENRMLVLNKRFDILGEYSADFDIEKLHYFRQPYYGELISILQGRDEARSNIFIKIHKTSALERSWQNLHSKFNPFYTLLVLVLGILIGALAFKLYPVLLRRPIQLMYTRKYESRKALFDALTAFRHSRTPIDSNLLRLSLYFKNPPDDGARFKVYQKRLEPIITFYFDHTAKRLRQVFEKIRASKTGMNQLKPLEQAAERLERLLNEFADANRDQRKRMQHFEKVPNLIDDMQQRLAHLKSEVDFYFSTDIIEKTKRIVTSTSDFMRKQGIRFTRFLIQGDIDAKGLIDERDFTTVIKELFTNACNAMRDSARKELCVDIRIDERKIILDIIDTGSGISEEDQSKLFEREFSTNDGGGLGLYHAKLTLNQYGARIGVAESQPGRGTTMRVELKRV